MNKVITIIWIAIKKILEFIYTLTVPYNDNISVISSI